MLPEIEAWGEMTARLFGQLRRQAGMKPVDTSKDQEWYWSKQWQEWERSADEDIASGRVHAFNNLDDLIENLDT